MGLFAYSAEKRRSPYNPVNIASPGFKANPFPFYARLRAEAPAYRMTLPTRKRPGSSPATMTWPWS